MQKNTSVTLGGHFEAFISEKIKEGRFASKSEAVRAAMRLLEEHETEYKRKVTLLRSALTEGEESGESERSLQEIAQESRQEIQNGL